MDIILEEPRIKNKINASIEVNDMVLQHATLVRRVASKVICYLPDGMQFDDVVQTGMIGLIEAAKQFDATKGASFTTYASIRIRGKILDELRKLDWMPRSVQHNYHKVTEAERRVVKDKGREASATEIAAELEIGLDEYQTMQRDFQSGKFSAFDEIEEVVNHDCMYFSAKVGTPHHDAQNADAGYCLIAAIKALPERERRVLEYYYRDDMNLRETAKEMGICESRVCQIHSDAVKHLKAKFLD